MKLWTNRHFEGFYPVGTAAVVVAETQESAATYLNTFLAELSLPDSTPDQFEEMPLIEGQVSVLRDGNY